MGVFKQSHKLSLGMSWGLFPCHDINSMFFVLNHSFDILSGWQEAKCYWKINEALLGKNSSKENISFWSRIVSMYILEFNFPYITWRRPISSADIHNHIITLSSSQLPECNQNLVYIIFGPSLPNSNFIVSSFYVNCNHSSSVQLIYSFAQCSIFIVLL